MTGFPQTCQNIPRPPILSSNGLFSPVFVQTCWVPLRSGALSQVPVCSLPQVSLASFQIHFSHNRQQQTGWQNFSDVSRCNLTEPWCFRWTSRLSYITLHKISLFISHVTYSYNIENEETKHEKGNIGLNMENTSEYHFTSKIHVYACSIYAIPNSHIK